MPTATPLFEGGNMIGGVISTGQSIFASMKPLIILFVALAAGFFVIEFLLYIIRGVVESKQREQTTHQEVIFRVLETHYSQQIGEAFKKSTTNEELLNSIDAIETNYKTLANSIKNKFKGRR